MDLIQAVSWALVELQGSRPNVSDICRALESAMVSAASMDSDLSARTNALMRICRLTGDI